MSRSFSRSRANPAVAAVKPTVKPAPTAAIKPSITSPRAAVVPAPPSPPPRRRRRWAWLALPALLGLAVAAFVEIERRPVRLCKQWEQEARTTEGETLRTAIASLDAYGSFGIPALVRLLDCDRPDAANGARDALVVRLRRTTDVGAAADRAAAAQIADELAYLVGGRGALVSQPTADVALELLEVAGRLSKANGFRDDLRDRFVQTCDDVLRLAPSNRQPQLESLVKRSTAASTPSVSPSPDLPISRSEATRAGEWESGRAGESESTSTSPPAPLPLPVVAAPVPPPVVAEAAPQPSVAANAAAKINPIREPNGDALVQPAAASKTIGIVPPSLPPDVLRGDAWSLFARLHDADAPLAEAELRRRGFAPHEIELGRHLCDPNVDERRRYAKSLPSLGLDGMKPWLLHLSRDADFEIRLSAMAIMATTGDPELLARVRTMSLDDPSEEVRETAQRAAGTAPTRR